MSSQDTRVPKMSDLADAAVRRAVRNEALTHPATLYPITGGILGALAWYLFGSPVLLAAGLGAILTGLTGLTINYFFRDKTFAARYVEKLKQQLAARDEDLLTSLRQGLEECGGITAIRSEANQGLAQFDKVRQKYADLNALIEEKIGSGELTLGQIWAVAEQVYLGVLDNLKEVVSLVRGFATTDREDLDNHIKRLSRTAAEGDADKREMETLKKRRRLWKEQVRKVEELLARNEEALTQLEEITLAVSGIRSDDALAAVDTTQSTRRLQELGDRISRDRS